MWNSPMGENSERRCLKLEMLVEEVVETLRMV